MFDARMPETPAVHMRARSRPAVRVALTFALAVGLTAGPGVAASAVAGCSFDAPSGVVTVAATDDVAVSRAGNAIEVDGSGCGGATVTTTDLIEVAATARIVVEIDLFGGAFAPGATAEAKGTSEIEWRLKLAAGSTLVVEGGPDRDVVVGAKDDTGAGLAFGAGDDDLEVRFPSTDPSSIVLRGGEGNDVLRGDGLAARSPVSIPLELLGGAGDDVVVGGGGADRLAGNAGADVLRGGAGNDRLDGGLGDDLVSYTDAGAGVIVDLADHRAIGRGSDRLAALEWVMGSRKADRLRGDGGGNVLAGGPGADRIDGRAGVDWLTGGPGNDRLRGGAGRDVCDASPGSRDRTTGCEPG
jgi:Ca2+-binding RTX toxin-like protein